MVYEGRLTETMSAIPAGVSAEDRNARKLSWLTVTIGWDALRTGLGVATLDYGTHISAAETRRWACDAKIIPVVLGGKSEV